MHRNASGSGCALYGALGCQADFVAIELPLECFFVRLKAAVSSPRPNTNARGAQRRSTLAEGHRRRRRGAVLAAASPAPSLARPEIFASDSRVAARWLQPR